MTKFLQSLIKAVGNEYASIAEEGIVAGDVTHWVDTGSYSLNALMSGSIYKGIAGNKIAAFAGEESTGKTFYALQIAKDFLLNDPTAIVVYFASESDIGRETLETRGIDTSRFSIFPVSTVEEFRTQVAKCLTEYEEVDAKSRPKMFLILDSLGMLSTEKEAKDIEDGVNKRDMTKQQLLRGTFRVLTLRLGKLQVPMLVVNHTYEVIGSYVPTKEMSGGGGLKFAASQIVFLSKKKGKEKIEGKDTHIGAVITAKLDKSRMTIEGKTVETLLRFDTGLDRYYGLLSIAENAGVVKKLANKYEFPDGTKAFESEIEKNPEKYFTKPVLDAIDAECPKMFMYGTSYKEEGIDNV